MKKLLLLVAIVGVVFLLNRPPASVPSGASPMAVASEEWQSGDQVSGEGTVTRILDDDNAGDRHQRFILALASGQTILVAHNIDLASRIDALQVGDAVEFSGEFEWNNKGGVVHWTHHDPQGQHEAGWLKHRGRTHQ